MNESLLLTIQAVVWMVVGLAFIFIPIRWSAPFDFPLDRSGVFFARLAGSVFVGFAVLDWLARDQDRRPLGRSSSATSSPTPSASPSTSTR